MKKTSSFRHEKGAKILAIGIAGILAQQSQAAITVHLNGNTGSNVISYVVSGSVTASTVTSAVGNATVARVPVGGTWDDRFDNNLGDILSTYNSSDNDDLLLSAPLSVVVTIAGTPSTIGIWDSIDLDPSNTPGQDDIEFDPTRGIPYPSLGPGDTISIPLTAGTFTLETGTYDSIFTEGTYPSSDLDASGAPVYVVNVGIVPPMNAIPEPTSSFVLGLCFLGMISLRRR